MVEVHYNYPVQKLQTCSCEYQLWIWAFMWLRCIMYHTCQTIFIFTGLLRALHVCDCICVCIYVCAVNLNQGHEWSEAAELCVSVTIDPVYWQPSLLIKSQPSIRELTLLLLTHFGASACRVEVGGGGQFPLQNLIEFMKVFRRCVCLWTHAAGSFHTGR